MNRATKIVIAAAAAAVVIGGISAAIIGANAGEKETEPVSAPRPSATANIDPSPSADPDDITVDEPAPTEEESLDLPSDTPVVDTREHRNVAAAALAAYVTVNPGETADARATRLAPFFPVGSDLLTEEPVIANPESHDSITSTVVVEKTTIAAIPVAESNTLVFDGILTYSADYSTRGTTFGYPHRTLKWKVIMDPKVSGGVLDIIEPISDLVP